MTNGAQQMMNVASTAKTILAVLNSVFMLELVVFQDCNCIRCRLTFRNTLI